MEQAEPNVIPVGRWKAVLRGLAELAFAATMAALMEQEVE